MAVIPFSKLRVEDVGVGGKAWGLARLTQLGFQVPPGIIISKNLDDEGWAFLMDWWASIGKPQLAVRSSAAGEDSKNHSFAGQNRTFLNVVSEEDLRVAIQDCFASVKREASEAYRKYFSEQTKNENLLNTEMNVVVQQMIKPKFSGVFFSQDPRSPNKNWLLEVVAGLGENLVSGKVTPGQINQDGKMSQLPIGFSQADAEKVAGVGKDIAEKLSYAADIEWAIDDHNELFILQTRPITTPAGSRTKVIEGELSRLLKNYALETPWDGQTFSEWSGFPSYFTFSIWKNAFSPHNAFGNALKQLGYESFSDAPYSPKDSLLERVFGRAYINLERLSDLYYGPIPYRIELKPRPHTVFTFEKINWTVLKHMLSAMRSMLHVGWNLSSKRKLWLDQCSNELNQFKLKASSPLDLEKYASRSNKELFDYIKNESWRFSKEYLHWPLVLVVLTESTIQRLHLLLKGMMDEAEIQKTLRDWMGRGLHTITSLMREEFQEAMSNPSKRAEFIAKFGHRGPGEMDLANPRWRELDMKAFGGGLAVDRNKSAQGDSRAQTRLSVEAEIEGLRTFKREVILEEWNLLKKMLELRELWKMELLKPYAGIRYALNELGARWGLGEEVHWLRLSEIEKMSPDKVYRGDAGVDKKISDRKDRFKVFKEFYFPSLVSLNEITKIVSGEALTEMKHSFEGEPLSSGIVKGEVRVVEDVAKVDASQWPENTIIVAETTDPGWTPLFIRAKAIVIQNGGVLSHCAIVAREMGIPAVSGIRACHKIFKDGDIVWVDGNLGRVSLES